MHLRFTECLNVPTFITLLNFLLLSITPFHVLGTKLASIPITQFSSGRSKNLHLHPSLIHQQHTNRGIRRLAVMTGRPPPRSGELLEQVHNRIALLPIAAKEKYGYKASAQKLAEGGSTDTGGNSSLDTIMDETTPSTTDGIQPHFPDTIGLDIQENDIGYIGVVQIGTPARDFNLLIDSGSADLWVGSETCRGDGGGGCGAHHFLGPLSSSTFEALGDDWAITYGSGSVSGYLARDDVSIAELHVKALKFGVAQNESTNFTPDFIPFDGLLGLAKSIISQQRIPTVVEALQSSGNIKDAIVSYRIPRLADGKNDGEMTLGALNPSMYHRKTLITVKNKNPFGFWEIPLDGVHISGQDLGWSNRSIVLDTGTTLLLAPPGDVDILHSFIPGAKITDSGWTVPCTLETSLTFIIGGRAFEINPRDLAFLPVDPNDPTGDCISGIAVGYVGPFDTATEWLAGDVFLKNVYFSTHEGRDEISIAKLR